MSVMTTDAGGKAGLERIVYTSVFVSDQDRALDFYTNVLGFEQRVNNRTPDGPRFLTVAVKGQDFQLVLWPGTPGQAQPVYGRIPATYTIETGDCRKAYDALKARGVKFDTGCSNTRGATSRCSRTLTAIGFSFEKPLVETPIGDAETSGYARSALISTCVSRE